MSTTKQQRELIAAFAQEWGVPVSVVERLLARTADVPTTDGEELSHTPTTIDNHLHTIYEGDAPQPPAARFGVAQPMRAEATISITDEAHDPTSSGVAAGPFQLSHLGRYEDLGLLGVGGMGEVRQVRDPDLRRTLAMKIIHPRLLEHPRSVSRFVEEAQIEAQLQHPNIVPVHELGQLSDGRHYFTMKEIRGTEFSKKIRAVHALSELDRWRPAPDGTTFRDLVRIFRQVCDAVAFAHSQGVIHRDLKPDNIMIGDFGEVLVVDWGLAKVLGREGPTDHGEAEDFVETDRSSSDAHQTRMGSIAGTPCYMAPEQAFGHTKNVGMTTDVYTLGSILYEILSGNPPFTGETADEVLEKVKNSHPEVLRTTEEEATEDVDDTSTTVSAREALHVPLAPYAKTPDRLAEICEMAMQREITDRTESAAVLAAEVKSWLEGAEKRDKALDEMNLARQLSMDARAAERQSIRFWEHANQLLEDEGATSDTGWKQWSMHCESASEGRKLWRRHSRRLQGSLVHAPDLEEAHEALAILRMTELFEATALGNRLDQEALKQQLTNHMQFLSAAVRKALKSRMETGLTDGISSQRLRRGALVGRYEQRESVAIQCRSGARFITLLGTAGVGKTRLALELAEDMRSDFERTVFCDLTQADDAMTVALYLSRALDVRLRDTDPMNHLAELLATESTLLVLDNLEQLTSVVGPMISDWLFQSETLQVLCTSRQKLNTEGEAVVPIQPMSLLEGVDLFVRRGQAANQQFELGPENRVAVCTLVQQLDGLPLAIELAAARLNIFGLNDLSQRLDERFSLLRSRGRDGQALKGALDWSWELLEPWAKAALSQASLFRGGFTLAAAEGVIQVSNDAKLPGMFDILGELVDNSLLRGDQGKQGVVRYRLLESIRAYASERLGTIDQQALQLRGPEPQQQAQARHATFFSQMGTAESIKALDGFDSGKRWDTLFGDLDNLVVGTKYGTSQTAPRCCLAALKVLTMKGPMSLGVELTTEVLTMTGLQTRIQMLLEIERSRFLRISGRLAEARDMVMSRSSLSPDESTENTPVEPVLEQNKPAHIQRSPDAEDTSETVPLSVEQALVEEDRLENMGSIEPSKFNHEEPLPPERAEMGIPEDTASNPTLLEAEWLMEMGLIEMRTSMFEKAGLFFEQAVVLFQRRGDRLGESQAVGNLGTAYRATEQADRAIDCFVQAIDIAREIGNKVTETSHLGNLALLNQAQGRHDRAQDLFTQVLVNTREIGDERSEGACLGSLGNIYQAQGRYTLAVSFFVQALEIAKTVDDKSNECIHLGNLGTAYRAQGQNEKALELFTQALTIAREIEDRPSEATYLGNLGDTLFAMQHIEEAKGVLEQAIAIGLEVFPLAAGAFRGSLAVLLAQENRMEEAKKMLDLGEALVKPYREEYAKFLTKKCQTCHLAGDADGARTTLEQARALATDLKLGDASTIGQSIQELASMLERHATGASNRDLKILEAERMVELGNLELEQSHHDEALHLYQKALSFFEEHGDRSGEGIARGQLGTVYQAQGELDRAIECFTQAIAIGFEIGNKAIECMHLGNLAAVYQVRGEAEQAIETFSKAINLARKSGNKRREGIHLGNLGNVYRAQGENERAVELFTQAAAIAHKIGDKRSEGIALGNLGDTLTGLGRSKEAEDALKKAISIGDETYPLAADVFRGSLALLLAQHDQIEEAQLLLGKGETWIESQPEEYAKFLGKKAHVQHLAGDVDAARLTLDRARALADTLNFSEESEVAQSIQNLTTVIGDGTP
jgi:tetratricopeptide (TPR) repeat protein/serine/threonine protein kinase/predicted ATPase